MNRNQFIKSSIGLLALGTIAKNIASKTNNDTARKTKPDSKDWISDYNCIEYDDSIVHIFNCGNHKAWVIHSVNHKHNELYNTTTIIDTPHGKHYKETNTGIDFIKQDLGLALSLLVGDCLMSYKRKHMTPYNKTSVLNKK